MKNQSIDLKVGDSVRVKKGIMCPDYQGLCLEDFQGRIKDFGENDGSV